MATTANMLTARGIGNGQWGPFDLDLGPGECVSLRGPSGTGKTRLLRALADLDPHRGQLALEGEPAEAQAPTLWRRRVGYLPAEPQWWFETAQDHFRENPPDLAALDLDPALLQAPISHLSTGERQRLALLRLLAQRPRVLLLDEPTAALDNEVTRKAEDLVRDYRRTEGAAVLWVTHDPDQAARVADRRLHMRANRLEEETR